VCHILCLVIPRLYIVYLLLPFSFTFSSSTVIYNLSLHDALPIFRSGVIHVRPAAMFSAMLIPNKRVSWGTRPIIRLSESRSRVRSEEHTSELQSRENLVCRLLLDKKKINL